MRKVLKFVISILLYLSTSAIYSQEVSVNLSINSAKVTGEINPFIYGQFLEHIYHSLHGGLYGDIIWNRSFEENCSRSWNRNFDEIPCYEDWKVINGILESPVSDKEVRFNVGDGSWRDYEFSVEAKKKKGENGFIIGVRSGSFNRCYAVVLGSESNTNFQICRYTFDKPAFKQVITVLKSVPGEILADRWYKIKMRCDGANIKVWIDGKQIFDVNDSAGQQFGQVCVGSVNTSAVFRNFRISSLKNDILYSGNPSPVRHWQVVGNATVFQSDDNPVNSKYNIKVQSTSGKSGIQQKNLNFEKGNVCRGSIWLKGNAPEGILVCVSDGEKSVFKEKLIFPTSDWKEYFLELTPTINSKDATLQIITQGKADFSVDQITLMADSSKSLGGFRPDLFRAMKDIKPAIIRWPGGSFLNRYKWLNATGPQSGRIGKKGWDELDPLSFGIDEFIQLCRKLNAEPLIPLAVQLDSSSTLQEAIDLISYCNDPETTKWGKLRAANGSTKPYNVKYWEIGNEEWGIGATNYTKIVRTYVPLMKKADPSIKIAICGSGGLGKDGRGQAWNKEVIDSCADISDYISIHHYENPKNYIEGPLKFKTFWEETGSFIQKSKNPDFKIFVSEWNAQTTDWRSGLYCGSLLNEFEKSSGLIKIATPALWLRHTSAPQWDNAFINFNQKGWFAGGNYVVMKLWRENYAPLMLELSGDKDNLNCVATKSIEGNTIYLKIVNPTNKASNVRCSVSKDFDPANAVMDLISPGNEEAVNSIENQNRIQSISLPIKINNGIVEFKMPSVSAGVIKINKRK